MTGWNEESRDGKVVLAPPRVRGMEKALRPSMGAKGGGRVVMPVLLLLLMLM